MAPDVNWEIIGSIAKGGPKTNDEEHMEQVADELKGLNENDFKDDNEKLLLLVQSAKKILDYREASVEEILQEQADQLEDKEVEIRHLQKELDDERKFGGGNVPQDAEYYRAENRRLMASMEQLHEEVNSLKQEMSDTTAERDKMEQEMDKEQKLSKDLRRENKDLRQELRDYREALDNQQQMKHSTKGLEDSEMRDKLNEKNRQISDLITQITQLEELNRELDEANRNLRLEMESGQEDMEKMVDEYEKMKKVVGVSDHFTDDLHRQNAQLKIQVDDLRDKLAAKDEEEESIANAVSEKVEMWSKRLQERDQENAEQVRTISVLREKIAAASLDRDRVNVERLTKKVEDRDEQIKVLQEGLNQAINDLEEQTAIVQDLRKDKGTNREIIGYKSQIKELQAKVQQNELATQEAEKHRATAEDEAQTNDSKLTEALKRISQLESGQYGLTDAVNEIKDCNDQIRKRELKIQELTKHINQVEEKLNDLLEENEEYRDRLGVAPRDMEDIAQLGKSRALRQQQYRAENQILLKEIEKLEDERLELKQEVRAQAQSYTQKAMGEGLHPDDFETINDLIDELKRKRKLGINKEKKTASAKRSDTRQFVEIDKLSREAELIEKKLSNAQIENVQLKEESKTVIKENEQLRLAMKDILDELKKSQHAPQPADVVRIPSLERLLHAMEAKQHNDGSSYLKGQVDQLTGRNDELRSELKHVREQNTTFISKNELLQREVAQLQSEVEVLKKLAQNGSGPVSNIAIPKKIDPTSEDVINALNEQLIQILEETSKKDGTVQELKEALENDRRQLDVLRHQTHLLYKEYSTAKESWAADKKTLGNEKRKLQGKIEDDSVKIKEYDRLLDALKSNPDDMKKKLAETSRKVSLLRVNEKTLIRRHRALESTEDLLTQQNTRLRNEISQMEKAVSERIGYLERYRAMATYKINALQKGMENSVPESELTLVNRRFDELTSKYRDLLQKENQFVARNVKAETLQEEIKIISEEAQVLRQELSLEKEKRHTLEENFRKVGSLGGNTGKGSIPKFEASSALQQVTVLEMKELNERQRAEHATRMYNKLKSSLDEMQDRNNELENKFAQLTKLNLAAQQTERELRDELAEVVPRSVSDADRKKLQKVDEELAKSKVKISQLQDMGDIAHNQLRSVQSQQQARDREIKSLREQVRTFQVQGDEKALIGELNHQILNLQASEADAQRRLDVTSKNVMKLQAHIIKLEKQIDDKEDAIYLTRTESNNRNRQLKKTIQSLRQQFSGALPIAQQEKFAKSMIRLHEDKALIQKELKRTRKEREKLEDKLAETEIKQQGLEELRKAIQDGRGADKLTEWSQRMDLLRLQDMKLQRQVVRQNEQIKYLENMNMQHERTVSSLEEDLVQMLKAQESHQVEWEMRETELERLLDQFQSRQHEVVRKARRLDDIAETIPDPSLPVERQLTDALESIKKQSRTIRDLQGQLKGIQLENDRLKDLRHNLQHDVTTRDRVITDLRLHMPTTASVSVPSANVETESKQQLKVAVETIETLKKRLSAKEESLNRHKQLLEEARRENETVSAAHERELLLMQRKIQGRTDAAFTRFKQDAVSAVSRNHSGAPTGVDLRHVNELEDMVKEQDAAMSALMDRIRAANADVTKQKRIIVEVRRNAEAEKKKTHDEHEYLVNALRMKLAKKHRRVEDLEKELKVISSELDRQKEANTRAPATSMKNLVARLKDQLREKEEQQKKLSHALTELRADLVNQAQENIRAASAEDLDAANVKHVVEKRTAQYKLQIEELKDSVAELQRSTKQAKRAEETLKTQLKKVLEESEKKEQTIRRLKMDKRSLEGDITQLRDKVKRLSRSRGPESVIKFEEERPIKLKAEEDTKQKKIEPVQEDDVVAVDAGSEHGSRSSSSSSRVPRASFRSSSVAELEKLNRLRSENSAMKEEIENLKEKLKHKAEEPTKSTVEVAKWDAKKQWQGKVDGLKLKLEEKNKQIQAHDKQVSQLRDTISRLEREKSRLKSLPIGPPIHAQGTEEETAPPNEQVVRKQLHEIEDLSHRLHQLGEENTRLRRMNVLPRDKVVAEMEAKNRGLEEKLEALQKEILTAGLRQQRDESLAEQFRERENHFQGRVLKLAADNTELHFDVEQIKRDVPMLKERIEHQQQYIELLRSEKREAELRLEKVKSQPQRKPSGTSGKSVTELEKTVALMKKLVERVQRENEQLKKAPGVVSNEIMDQLKSENQVLKNRINEMTQQIGGQLSMRYESKTQSVERLMRENERLRKEVDKRSAARDKIKDSKAGLQTERDSLVRELEEVKKKLVVAERKAPKVAGAGSRGYNSAVTSRMLESRLQKAEEEIKKKNSEIKFLQSEIKEKGAIEEELSKDNDRLREQVEILERFPPGAGNSDANTVRELQLCRLTVARLENERDEFRHELELLRKRSGSGKTTANTQDENEHEVQLRDQSEMIRLGTELKKMQQENTDLQTEVTRLTKELDNFDDDFFEEIEDLKYNYAESVKKNVMYEEHLRSISQQFGVSIDLPSSES
uniref:Centrosomal protein of 290 kDa n=1 Tax=Phallusia mammillata TaxID=59560 RepID=A0A6F9D8V9_9ASCI|nr:centrosomal protein of 290 kDa [Phallusia mammillata]